jgi:hypothetical protein
MEKQTLVFRYLNIYVEDQDDAAKFFEELGFYKLIYHTYKNNGIPLMRKSIKSDLVIQIFDAKTKEFYDNVIIDRLGDKIPCQEECEIELNNQD